MRLAWLAELLPLTSALADERFFTYVQDADVIPKGGWEFEQWVTFRKGYPGGDRALRPVPVGFPRGDRIRLTDKLSGALYLNFRQDSDRRAASRDWRARASSRSRASRES